MEKQQNYFLREQIQKNRERILPIIKTAIFCGQQGLPLRGHRDSGPVLSSKGINQTENDGNFRALLRFRLDAGDHILDHLMNSAKNATYISPLIQNEIISACNEILLKRMVDRINKAQCFTVLADETTDIACIEQVNIAVRYYWENSIREEFLQFIPVAGTTGINLADAILKALVDMGITLEYLRGQGYDGAAAMSGKFSGVQTIIRERYPTAIYVHCAAHSLNLVLAVCTEIPEIRNFYGMASKVYTFLIRPNK